jgi:hypothetical protein
MSAVVEADVERVDFVRVDVDNVVDVVVDAAVDVIVDVAVDVVDDDDAVDTAVHETLLGPTTRHFEPVGHPPLLTWHVA